ncbi:MAG: carboxypeptidase regulatory-like domain-containing protein [Planctomycetota bacterium]
MRFEQKCGVWAVGIAMLALSAPIHAQVVGIVTDAATTNPIEGAVVTIQSTEIRTTTDATGSYTLNGASPAVATMTFVAAGPVQDEFGTSRGRITRTSGSFIADGYVRGMEVTITGSSMNDGMVRIAVVNETTLDLEAFFSILDEGPTPAVTITHAPIVVTAAQQGYFTGSTTASITGNIALEAVPQEMNNDYVFLSEFQCGFCHPKQFSQWDGSPMQRAGLNEWVYDIYNGTGTPGGMGGFVYTEDSVHATTFPEAECASCHQPEAWVKDPFNTALADISAPTTEALRGVSCETCHKVADVDPAQINATGIIELNGAVTFTRPELGSPQVMYGVLGDVDFNQPVMRASYNPDITHETCATCHQYTNDHDKDFDWEDPGSVPAQETYAEWQASTFGDPLSPNYATCADCHMAPFAGVPISTCDALFPPLERDPDTIHTHDIRGTTPFFLENSIELTGDVQLVGDQLTVEIDATNTGAGHSVPTGITLRNIILLIEAFDADGDPLPYTGAQTLRDEAGIGDPTLGYYAGLPGKLYAKILGDGSGQRVVIFTEAFETLYNERIPAQGTDSTSYTFQVPAGETVGEIRARMIYRRAYRDLVDAKGWTETGSGEPLADLAPPYYGHLMEELFLTAPEAVTDIVFAGEAASEIDSVAALVPSLEANGRVVSVVTELTDASIAGAETVWVCLGTFPDNHELTPAEGQALADANTAGVSIYVEGGDTVFFDPATAFSSRDGATATSDGDDSLIGLVGLDSGVGLSAAGLTANYNQDQIGNDFTDHLVPTAEDGGPDVGALWADDMAGGGSGYTVAVYYNSTFAPVITQSFEFGGYAGDQVGLAALYLQGLKSPSSGEVFDRGDCNGDGALDIGDAIFILGALFSGGPEGDCADACDVNDDGAKDIGDAIYALGNLFSGGPNPPAPFGACGPDPTDDPLDCASYTCP